MEALLLAHETLIRGAAFVGIFAAMAVWELAMPRRGRVWARRERWPGNVGIVLIDTAVVRLALPLAAVGTALAAAEHGWGLAHRYAVPSAVAGVAGLFVLDAAIYLQHVVFHRVPVLWRVHRLHHADLDVDATTALRFHPIEIVLSMLFKMGLVAALGVPAWSVLVFEITLNGAALFNHGNVAIPPRVDRWLRKLIVTPDVHRVHHSVIPEETNSNYGFNLIVWDRLFGTYRAEPAAGHTGMRLGLEYFREPSELKLARMLWQPFRENPQ